MMIENLRITVLVDDTVTRADLLAEHGLAYWIEADDHRFLFDTGQGEVLRRNAEHLGVDLRSAEMIVLSHGHYDHTGGLKGVLEEISEVDIYLHPAAMAKKYARLKNPPHREIGIPGPDRLAVEARQSSVKWTQGPMELFTGVHLTGEVPRRNDFEDTGGPFYLDAACTRPDPLVDDQALYVETPAGIVVVLGCAHSGVVNILDYVCELRGRRQIHAVLGGMHLVGAERRRLDETVAALARLDVQKIAPAHCTGMRSGVYLCSRLPGRCVECPVGATFRFG